MSNPTSETTEQNEISARKETPSDWVAMPLRSWCRKVGISPSHAYMLAAGGKLKITKVGCRSLITRTENNRILGEMEGA